MGDFWEFMAPISMIITAVLLLLQNVIEDKQEKEEAKLRETEEAYNEIKKRWENSEKR